LSHQEGVQLKIKSQTDLWSGIMFIGFGLLAVWISRDYPFGTASRMGPGFFPTWIGIIMASLGVLIALASLKSEEDKIGKWAWRPMILMSVGFVLFGWGIDHIGFIPASFGLVIIGAAAGTQFKWKEVIPLAIGLVIGCWALFIKGLELPFPLFWWR
jgi:hypothetical protein